MQATLTYMRTYIRSIACSEMGVVGSLPSQDIPIPIVEEQTLRSDDSASIFIINIQSYRNFLGEKIFFQN